MSTEADNEDPAGIPHGRGQQLAAAVDYADTPTLPFPVIGIGASAGGIQAVCELLEYMPRDSGMAFVVIQHLPPDHNSILSEIFSRHTPMPVHEIEDGMKLEANTVYVIRPAFSVTMDGGCFSLGEPVEERGHRRPIDDFFRSLARVQREKAIAVVLSGVGTNGTSGAQAIKAAGGVCIAQDPDTADFGGMPRSLINSGYADHVCKVAEMPQVLIRYVHHPYVDAATRGREHAEEVTSPYVTQPSGEPTRDVFEVMKPSLRAAARTALRRAASKGEPVTIFADSSGDESPRAVHLTAAPLPTARPSEYFRLTFELASKDSGQAPVLEHTGAGEDSIALAAMPTALETGKEELQSLNEELITVNAQLQAKIAELEATANDLSNLLSSTNIAVVFLDTQFRVRSFTPAVYDLLELIPGDIGRPIANLAQKFVGGGLLEDARAVLARLIPLETEVLSNSGAWYLRRTLPYRTADNHIDGVVITFVDISARRRAEQAVESSQARLRAILEQMPVAMLMVDAANGTLLHANRPAAQLMNLPFPVPTVGSEWRLAAASFQGTHPDGRAYNPQDWPLAQSLAQGIAVAAQEIDFRHPDGTSGVLSMSSTPVLDAEGKMVVAVATMFDITEQRRAAERLRESEQRLQLLIDSALDYAIFMIDLESRVISWNRGAERLLGWSEEEAVGRSAALIFTPEDRGAGVPEREMETAKREGRAVDERVHQRKNGERFWASGMLMAVYDDKGTLCRYAKIIRDETERKRAEENLQRALHEAERVRASAESANRAKDEFISTISHELRTPLNTIRLWARMLGSERLPEQDRLEGVRMIDRSAEAQQHLIDDLLDVSRMSSGQLRLNLRLTRLADVVHSAIESVRPSAEVRKVQIVTALSDDVGVVRADPERMQQVLLNLVSNAVKFTPGGGRIDVQMTRSGDDVIVVVKDTGIGIRAEFLPHVFERFRQAEIVATRQHGGLGLGLAIVRQLVELHGGTIVATSEGEGQGATFTATLPLPKSSSEHRDVPSNLRALPQGIDNLRILLVEDDTSSRMATCRALELRGAIMDAVPNATLAMAAYTQTRPDAMILDIGLPTEDGYSLVARMRELEAAQGLSRVPAIALTAFARSHDRERAFTAGFDEHLAKPVDIETLVATLLRLTRRNRS